MFNLGSRYTVNSDAPSLSGPSVAWLRPLVARLRPKANIQDQPGPAYGLLVSHQGFLLKRSRVNVVLRDNTVKMLG